MTPDPAHHLTRVLRCKGDRVNCFGGKIVLALCFSSGCFVRECYRLPLRRDRPENPPVVGAFKDESI